jgi:Ca2+-binding RTX toxin-like protein
VKPISSVLTAWLVLALLLSPARSRAEIILESRRTIASAIAQFDPGDFKADSKRVDDLSPADLSVATTYKGNSADGTVQAQITPDSLADTLAVTHTSFDRASGNQAQNTAEGSCLTSTSLQFQLTGGAYQFAATGTSDGAGAPIELVQVSVFLLNRDTNSNVFSITNFGLFAEAGALPPGRYRFDIENSVESLQPPPSTTHLHGDFKLMRCTISCSAGTPCMGTAGDDVICGTDGDDEIHGLGGNDTIFGNGGKDTIEGGDGSDTIFGGPGDDIICGDEFSGDVGRVFFDEFACVGGAGERDTIYGGPGLDVIGGGDGDDTIFGGPGNAVGTGDLIQGGFGNDTIIADRSGVISGGPGNDTITGGDDNTPGLGGALKGDGICGASWDFDQPGNDVTGLVRCVNLSADPDDDTISGGGGNDTLRGGEGADTINGGAGDDMIVGDGGPDKLFGDGGQDKLLGRGGNDKLHGGAGHDVLNGGPGRDRLFGDGGPDKLIAQDGEEDKVVDGGSGDDIGQIDEGIDPAVSIETFR